jgi:hypothetical protein
MLWPHLGFCWWQSDMKGNLNKVISSDLGSIIRNVHALIHLLKLSILLAILIAALPISNAMPTSSDIIESTIGQSVADYLLLGGGTDEINVTFLGGVIHFSLNPPALASQSQGTLFVSGEGSWHVSVFSDTLGYLAESDENGYVPHGKKLHTPLTIIAQGCNRIDLSEGGILIEGSDQQTIPITFEQPVVMSDEALLPGHFYNSKITFIGSRG